MNFRASPNFDMGAGSVHEALATREKISKALQAISDTPSQGLDSGGGIGGFDLWVWIDRKEWLIQGRATGKERKP